jgi:peptidoglycan hydrolase-like protein with peptidoglycan-binding domain
MLHLLCTLRVRTVVWLAVLIGIPALPGTAMAQGTATAQGLSPGLLADASWHGRPIQRPLPRRSDAVDRAPSLHRGTGYSRPGGSRRVRDLQRRLTRLGYRPGARDGLFGPRTQAAVLAFQRKHGLQRTGSVGSATLRILHRRTAHGATANPATPPVRTQAGPPEAPPRTSRPVAPARTTQGLRLPAAILIVALGVTVLMAVGALLRHRRRPAPPAAEAPPATGPLEPALTGAPRRPVSQLVRDIDPAIPPPPRITRPRPRPGPPRERRAALRERILSLRADGMTLQQIADLLTAEGEPTLGGGRHWQPWSVRAALRPYNPGPRTLAHDRREAP